MQKRQTLREAIDSFPGSMQLKRATRNEVSTVEDLLPLVDDEERSYECGFEGDRSAIFRVTENARELIYIEV